MTKTKNNAPECAKNEAEASAGLSSLEEVILRMRYGLLKENNANPEERKISEDLKKKLHFLELKAFEQSGKIKDLIAEIESKGK